MPKLFALIEDETGVKPTAETPVDALGDSLDYLSLTLRIEEVFSVAIPKDALLNFETVGDMAAWLQANPCA